MPNAAAPAIDLEAVYEGMTHIEWAERRATAIAHAMGLRGEHEVSEIVSRAHLLLARRVRGEGKGEPFDPALAENGDVHGLFRGWVDMSLKWECIKAAQRLRLGGLAPNPTPGTKRVRVGSLPCRTDEHGREEVEVADWREPEGEGESAEPEADDYQPPARPKMPDNYGRRFARPRHSDNRTAA